MEQSGDVLASTTPEPEFRIAFQGSVAHDPDRLAVASGRGRVSYRELDRWACAIASHLFESIGSGEEPVAILGANDEWSIAAFVGAERAGRTSILLDSSSPSERIRTVCDVGRPAALLFDPELGELAAQVGDRAGLALEIPGLPLAADDEWTDFPDSPSILTIYFTSGSTGRPKGVSQGSRELVQSIAGWDTLGGLGDKIGCPIPVSFAFGTNMVVRALISASELHLCDPRSGGIQPMPRWIQDSGISSLGATPFMLRSLTAAAQEQGVVLDTLRHITTGGEAVLVSDVEGVQENTGPDCVVHVMLGSSEAAAMTRLSVDRHYRLPSGPAISTGTAAPFRDVWLEDENGARIDQPGRIGTLIVAGTSLALGYWGDPDATAARFSLLEDGRRVYNSGDLGKWNDRGELEFIGRSDHMLKIRGYLVEPAEVEGHLAAEGELAEVVVVGTTVGAPAGSVRLVAYVVPRAQKWVSAAALRRRLYTELPSYMVPSQIIELDALPRNANGKLDRLALPQPTDGPSQPEQLWGYPHLVAGICATALGLEHIGAHDDVFALGADSLAVEEIAAALEAEFNIEVSSATVMEYRTVAKLAELPRLGTRTLVDGVLTTLREGTEIPPIFAFVGGGAITVQLRDLSQRLGGDRTVCGLQAYGLEGGGRPDFTVPAMSRRFLSTIRRVQPHGPYVLVGHSLGALVAYEVARRLRRAGEHVAYVGLLDPPQLVSNRSELRNFRGVAVPDGADRDSGEPGQTSVSRRVRFQRWLYSAYPHLTRTHWRNVRAGGRFRVWFEFGAVAARLYRPPRGGLDVWNTTTYLAADTVNPLPASWFARPARIVRVEGDHITMLRAPFVTNLAALVTGDIEGALASSSTRDG